MLPENEKSSPLVRKKKEFSLSGEDFSVILQLALEKGASVRFRAKGFSMAPFIRNGDILSISPRSGRELRMGEVAAFLNPRSGRVVVHRMIRRSPGHFVFKGDNVLEADERIPRDNVLGVVRKIERGQKRVFLGLGPERYTIAFLSRVGFQYRWLSALSRIVHSLVTRDSR